MKPCALPFLLAAALGAAPPADYVAPKDPAVQARLAEWRDRKFGLFMHWGPYSQWGVVESWSICPEDHDWNGRSGPLKARPYAEYKAAYEALGTTFHPGKFDPAAWAQVAKEAGMKYLVFTTKHHDGFCMWNTDTTDYKVGGSRSPERRDLVKEVFEAFRAQDFRIGVYFSKADWNTPHYWNPAFPPTSRSANYDIARRPDWWKGFVQFTHRQVEELMTRYGRVDILWLDAGWVAPPKEDIDMPGMAAMARRHQPGLIVVDREVHGPQEDYRTPEQKVPDQPLPYPWETCMTLGDSWSYVPGDRYKSARTIVHTLSRIVSRGGNLLLNVGPGPDGTWDPVATQRLKEIGAWLKVHGDAIYGTEAVAPYASGDLVFTRRKEGTVHALCLLKEGQAVPRTLDLPASLVPEKATLSLLGVKGRLAATRDGATVRVELSPKQQKALEGSLAFALRIQ